MGAVKEPPLADICMIVEGTYPFVTGGVSSWIHFLITSLPEKTFSILHITSSHPEKPIYKYKIPDNVVSMVIVSLHDSVLHRNPTPGNKNEKKAYEDIYNFHKEFPSKDFSRFDSIFKHLVSSQQRSLNTHGILESRETWESILKIYTERKLDKSFIDYFWTWRFLHIPIFQMLNAEIPPARVYHSLSTGYSGLVGVIARFRYQSPLLLTEHGIYTKERDIEIRGSDWIYSDVQKQALPSRSIGFFSEKWRQKFFFLSHLIYEYSDKILTISNQNLSLQIEHGADPSKCRVIPNAINTSVFQRRDKSAGGKSMKVGYIGRVVPIKDVKTLIKACKLVSMRLDQAEFLIMGPLDEDEDYAKDCVDLAKILEIESKVHFLGRVNVREYLPQLRVNVLTSVSEGQPLTILEAMAIGVPNISTDVGACREMLYGLTEEDIKLGKSGIITNLGSPDETAEAIIRILSDDILHDQMVESGFHRVQNYYRSELLVDAYRDLYEKYMLVNSN